MTLAELSAILRDMYDNAPRGEKAAMIHLFGIRYADEIRAAGYTANDIARAAQMTSYAVEVNKGMHLARYVKERDT